LRKTKVFRLETGEEFIRILRLATGSSDPKQEKNCAAILRPDEGHQKSKAGPASLLLVGILKKIPPIPKQEENPSGFFEVRGM
jgi:hypothetical protein